MNVRIKQSRLKGELNVPPSKSLSHRVLIASALSKQRCEITNMLFSDDVFATIQGLEQLGTAFVVGEDSVVTTPCAVTGGVIDCNESGSTLRFLIPIALTRAFEITFTGKNNLVNRPLDVYFDLFKKKNIYYEKGATSLPLYLHGGLVPGDYKLRGDVSSQFITGLLFALPLLDGDSRIVVTTKLESRGYVDLTLDVLKQFGILVENDDYEIFRIKGNQKYIGKDSFVEGDFSQAAFWLVAGALGSEIKLKGMNKKTLQGDKEIIEILEKMSLKCLWNESLACKEGVSLATNIDLSQAPDLGPIVIVLAALSQGTTRIENASRLRLKESDRITAMCTELNKLGAKIQELPDGMIIEGVAKLHGGEVDSWNDHRIAMALAIASLRAKDDVIINNAECVKKSYPHFFADFIKLGGVVEYE